MAARRQPLPEPEELQELQVRVVRLSELGGKLARPASGDAAQTVSEQPPPARTVPAQTAPAHTARAHPAPQPARPSPQPARPSPQPPPAAAKRTAAPAVALPARAEPDGTRART